ncbi:hypothetical protein CUMW_146120 [Citrus unshiu]|nr:hypothetical protein CUMW_146120 [Citrus unshiu]
MADLVLLCTQQLPFFLSEFSFAPDIITSSHTLNDGRTLISKDGSFELGFFSPGSSKNRYVGIWYKNIPVKTVVWVTNRLNLINDSSGFLMINKTGNLVLTSKSNIVVWSAYLSKEVRTPVVLQLLDSGNLVLRGEQDGDSETYFWQSFDYPSDTLLPGMKLGWDLETGLERRVTSWKSFDDPSPGDFIWAIERQDNPEVVMWKGSRKFYRTGPWNGLRFSAPSLRPNPVFIISRIIMNQTLYVRQRFIWNKATQSWELYSDVPRDQCDTYGLCGAYGICIISQSPVCQCLKGFKHKSGGYVDWSKGCVRNKLLNYSRQDGFMKFTELKLPDATPSWVSKSMNLKESREGCLENSFCMAYTNSDIRGGGSGCAMWFGDLIDMRSFPDGGQDLYIRMSASELGAKGEPTTKIVVIVTSTAALLAAVIADGYLVHKRRRNIIEKTENNRRTEQKNEDQNIDLELPLFELATIANATDNFSINNKLGEGGFGPVYKGTLVDGQEIAVKRLSKISDQGLKELKNEVILFSKLQHRNLAWKLWNEGMPLQLIDACYQESCNRAEVIRCVHISLLCVQQHPDDRPSMPSVILMLGSEIVLPQPKQPGFLANKKSTEPDSSSSMLESSSTNTITISELEGMKVGWDLKTGLERRLTSWKSSNDPSPGDLILKIERQGYPYLVMWKGSTKFYRTGPWNGVTFSASSLKPNSIFNVSFVFNEDELYYTFNLIDKAVFSRTVVNQTLSLRQRFVWSKATQSWELYSNLPRDQCDTYNLCGAYGICSISKSPICQCLIGFKPKSEGYVERSQGCVRTKPLNYSRRDGFVKFNDLKLPDSTSSWVSKSMNLNECLEKCSDNSSCMAYTNSDIRGEGSGCAMWFGDLIDIRYFQDGGQDLYIRMSASELEAKGEPTTKIVVIVISSAALLAVLLIAGYLIRKRRRNIAEKTENDQIQNIDLELPLFELATIVSATNNFSINKKLGQGGFGPVYKGKLVDGQEIAVKRLSKISEQGLKELKNEAWKLWNEGMPSQLIDSCFQDSFNLAEVIRCIHIGLLCVQQHPEDRPSMPSVILMLGSETVLPQPKQPGYLADRKSTRRDYSSIMPESCSTNTITAWKLWNEGMPSQLIDPCIQGSFNLAEVIRCIHIGLLCVQQHPKDRPSMPSVILMLGSETVLPQPKQPGYLADRNSTRLDSSSSRPESSSTNTITISELEGR